MKTENQVVLEFPSRSANEGFARTAAACFAAQMDPTLEEVNDVKTAVSEAVTNAIVHAYAGRGGEIYISVGLYEGRLIRVEIRDRGCGIPDVKTAMQPLYTTDKTGERSGMGFAVMGSFMSRLHVSSKPEKGTRVTMWKQLG